MKRTKKFLINAAVLSLTSLIMQSVGLSFGIFISSKVGAEGMGLYSLITVTTGLAVTLSTSGIHLATVRLISEASAKGSADEIKKCMRRCILYASAFGFTAFAVLFFFADAIGKNILNDVRTVSSLRIMALSMPFVAVSTSVSGYFSAVGRVGNSAVIRIIDSIINISSVAVLLNVLLPIGTEYACIAISTGAFLSESLSFIPMLILFIRDIRACRGEKEAGHHLTKKMFGITIPVALTAYAKTGLSTAKNLLIPQSLRRYGADNHEALAEYGMLTGMAMPVITFPQIIIGSFSGLMVPEITGSRAKGNPNNVRYIITRIYGIVTVFSIGAAAALFTFGEEIGMLFYNDVSAAEYIRMLSPLVPFLYTDGIVDAALTGVNEQVASMKINILDSVVSILFVVFLIPRAGAVGWVIMMYFCKIMNAVLSLFRLKKSAGFSVPFVSRTVKPLLCAAVSSLLSVFIKNLLFSDCSNGFTVAGEILFLLTVYWTLLRITGTVGNEEIRWARGIIS